MPTPKSQFHRRPSAPARRDAHDRRLCWSLVSRFFFEYLTGLILKVEVRAELLQRGMPLPADGLDHLPRLGVGDAADRGSVRLDDAGFFHGDLRQPIADVLGVIETDPAHDGRQRLADV